MTSSVHPSNDKTFTPHLTMKRNRGNARRKTPAEEEAGVSTQAAKKRNTTIVTGKGTEKAKKKSATKEHGDDEYSPENVVIAATENNNPSPLLNTMKLDEDDNYADNNNNDGPIISSVLPASVLPDALETAVNTAFSTQQVGGRIYSSTDEAWADACAAAVADIAYGVMRRRRRNLWLLRLLVPCVVSLRHQILRK